MARLSSWTRWLGRLAFWRKRATQDAAAAQPSAGYPPAEGFAVADGDLLPPQPVTVTAPPAARPVAPADVPRQASPQPAGAAVPGRADEPHVVAAPVVETRTGTLAAPAAPPAPAEVASPQPSTEAGPGSPAEASSVPAPARHPALVPGPAVARGKDVDLLILVDLTSGVPATLRSLGRGIEAFWRGLAHPEPVEGRPGPRLAVAAYPGRFGDAVHVVSEFSPDLATVRSALQRIERHAAGMQGGEATAADRVGQALEAIHGVLGWPRMRRGGHPAGEGCAWRHAEDAHHAVLVLAGAGGARPGPRVMGSTRGRIAHGPALALVGPPSWSPTAEAICDAAGGTAFAFQEDADAQAYWARKARDVMQLSPDRIHGQEWQAPAIDHAKVLASLRAQASAGMPAGLDLEAGRHLLCMDQKIGVLGRKQAASASAWYFIGDIHGDFFALHTIVETLRQHDPGFGLILLGDLIDRGPHATECVQLILGLAAERPGKVLWVAGNHDIGLALDIQSGVFSSDVDPCEFQDFLNAPGNDKDLRAATGRSFIDLARRLPRAVLLEDEQGGVVTLVTHGGVPHKDHQKVLADQHGRASPGSPEWLAWASSEACLSDFSNVRFVASMRKMLPQSSVMREMGCHDVRDFIALSCNNVKAIVRGHDHPEAGYDEHPGWRSEGVHVLTLLGTGFVSRGKYRSRLVTARWRGQGLPEVVLVGFEPAVFDAWHASLAVSPSA